ncbi:LacI family DNA-binding transcriptional regulator [Streptomyces litchfieldiae]|uniref:LacI family DNA-binding transcriptional regulator n=1 Tax=Streptomyces litchfieldiae TaxID=3075543 RepID=A0ABU2MQ01_9ACTN|nr:LacI family DNA-binding transcriptional regulator [Streptomyces sp. DSM 44938]MDT0343684.1 LacI family DNA-binding transcriptional regulator [Streptomyces sp. DSM 44938]
MTVSTTSRSAPRVKDVARHAGVSQGTVSNVLNRPWLVSPATRDRVRESIDELGFVRHEVARQSRAGQSRTVGLVVLDVASPFFIDVAHGAENVAWEHHHGDAVQQPERPGPRGAPPRSARTAARHGHPHHPGERRQPPAP